MKPYCPDMKLATEYPSGSGMLRARTYVIGFVTSLVLTLTAYALAQAHAFSTAVVVSGLIALAAIQVVVQLVCFLHLRQAAARERLAMLGITAVVVVILVSGSLWIMFDLNARMMMPGLEGMHLPTTGDMEQYMQSQAGI